MLVAIALLGAAVGFFGGCLCAVPMVHSLNAIRHCRECDFVVDEGMCFDCTVALEQALAECPDLGAPE